MLAEHILPMESGEGNAKMAFQIDLNEMPIASPREAVDDALVGSANASVCVVCRKGVPLGKVSDKVTGEQRHENKCFQCMLRNDFGGGGEAGRFDINASPPREAEDGDVVTVVASRDGTGGGRYTFFTFFLVHAFFVFEVISYLGKCSICFEFTTVMVLMVPSSVYVRSQYFMC